MREFPCQLLHVINGNTAEAEFDLGFGVFIKIHIRLFGVSNTDETKTALIKILPRKFICTTTYSKRGKVGRCLGHIYTENDDGTLVSINDQLIAQGFALATTT
jgi:hypothetical protein